MARGIAVLLPRPSEAAADPHPPRGRVLLAGDYLGTQYTESAVHTGFTAAEAALDVLASERDQGRSATQAPRSTAL